MAEQRMIGDILSERRHSLGLSIDRVVGDTKLQRRIIDAFEDSDFDAMPPKGYAQASLASYARYLGLNPNEILRIYDDQLYDYQRFSESASRPSRREREREQPEARRPRSTRSRSDYPERDERSERPARNVSSRTGSAYRDDGYGSYRRDEDTSPRDHRNSSRTYDRGLYESGHRRSERSSALESRSGRYDEAPRRSSSYRDDDYRDERRPSTRSRYDEAPSYADRPTRRSQPQGKVERGRSRGETQIVLLDDGYQGGSGGPEARESDQYRPRPSRRPQQGQRQSLSEVVLGFLDSVRSDRRTFAIIIGVVALTAVIVLAVSISSCMRANPASKDDDGTIPVTSMQGEQGTAAQPDPTPLAPSIDLANLPANSQLDIVVAADAPTAPWIEVYIDDSAVYAQITPQGSSLQWAITRNAVVKLSSIEGVSISVNGTAVTPTLDSATYVLNLAVAPDQQPQPEDAGSEAPAE